MQASFATEDGSVDYDDGMGISYLSAGKFCTGFTMGKREQDIRPVFAPGEDGGGTQNFGVRYQMFAVEVTYIGGDEGAVNAVIATDLATLSQVTDADFSDFTFSGCLLEESKFEQTRPASHENGTVQCKGILTFKSVRPPTA